MFIKSFFFQNIFQTFQEKEQGTVLCIIYVVSRDCRVAALLAMTFWVKCPDKSGNTGEQVSIEIINKQ